ncbi:RNase A-like domain-containing protein [Streptomyces sp. 796.1]|uniref:RNase A-like domain-containing protein n=1 Tax=Streptomyces sp. 796.1 TaxID=3163029 RepID=UPI0039C9D013
MGFDVQPAHMYSTSYQMRDQQFDYYDAARKLVDGLSGHQQAAGKGSGADAFAAEYKKVAALFLDVWSKSVVSVGGAAVGLTVTANNYAMADWKSNENKMITVPPNQKAPAVIGTAPQYGSVADIQWYGTSHDSSSAILRALGGVPDFIAGFIQPAIEDGLKLGETHEITPSASAFREKLEAIAAHWRKAGEVADGTGDRLSGLVGGITDRSDNEWKRAMNTFCQTIWGTTAWGRTREGYAWKTTSAPMKREPILSVLHATAREMAQTCLDLADAADRARDVSERAAIKAAKGMIKDMVDDFTTPSKDDFFKLIPFVREAHILQKMISSFRSHMDDAAINAAVEKYHEAGHTLADRLSQLKPALEEAQKSAPTFHAEQARAEAYGARSLNEFKKEHKWTVPGTSPNSFTYPIDLANQEGMDKSHAIDKHVGKTDAQLEQRLRDQSNIPAASTYTDLSSAQRFTQQCIEENKKKIADFIENPGNKPDKAFYLDLSGPKVVTGDTAFFRAGPNGNQIASFEPAYMVQIRVKPAPDLNPPFIILTSTPTNRIPSNGQQTGSTNSQ